MFTECKLYVKKSNHFWYLIRTVFKQEGTSDHLFQPLCFRICRMRTGNQESLSTLTRFICAPFPELPHTLPRLLGNLTRRQVAEERHGPGPLLPHSRAYERSQCPVLTILPNQSKTQLILVTGLFFRLLAKAPEEVFRHALDCGVRVNGGQDPVVVTQQPVQHEQGQGRGGGVRVDHDVFQCPVILRGENPNSE